MWKLAGAAKVIRRAAALIPALALAGLVAPPQAWPQHETRVFRIGIVWSTVPAVSHTLLEPFRETLRELGYREGRSLVLDQRWAEGRFERFEPLVADLLRLKPDVIVVPINPAIAAARRATRTIPIVMMFGIDPVGAGFITSLARPGGNITGLSFDPTPEITGKQLELLTEVLPRRSRVFFLWNSAWALWAAPYMKAGEDAADTLGITFLRAGIRAPDELDEVFATMARARAAGVLVPADPVFFAARSRIIALAARHRLPAMYTTMEFTEAGGLLSYGPSLSDLCRRAAVYVDRILRGARPADLPVEQPTRFELGINLGTAKALRLTLPQSLLVRADRLID